MKHLIIVSPDRPSFNELDEVCQMFECGLQIFHLRKPNMSEPELEECITAIPKTYWNRVVLHSHYWLAAKYRLKGIHLTERAREEGSKVQEFKGSRVQGYEGMSVSASFHSIADLRLSCGNYQYIFLSPVFDSISKNGYKSAFTLVELKAIIDDMNKRPHPLAVVALGGVDAINIKLVADAGFSGVALLGAIWNATNPVEEFLKIKNLIS